MNQKFLIVDTNILLYLKNQIPDFSKRAFDKIALMLSKGYKLAVAEQNIREFLVVQTNLSEIKKIEKFEIQNEFSLITSEFEIFYPSIASLESLKNYIYKYKLVGKKIHDANIVAVAAANNVPSIMTHNSSDFSFAIDEGFEIITLDD